RQSSVLCDSCKSSLRQTQSPPSAKLRALRLKQILLEANTVSTTSLSAKLRALRLMQILLEANSDSALGKAPYCATQANPPRGKHSLRDFAQGKASCFASRISPQGKHS